MVDVARLLTPTRGAGERRMFGGVYFTINGNMVYGVVKDDLMVRVGPDKYADALRQAHARPVDFIHVSRTRWGSARKRRFAATG